ncbi:MAG TPA: COX15/CtaA family protein [Burkholderiales bacterium]|nr:COX15/CtaA family protein [Burkholderiales bacterium]
MSRFHKWAGVVACLAFVVVVVGAYVRLMDAGLGCPDWPGCYGEITPHHASDEIAKAVEQQGGTGGPVSLPKAWKEMVHRYLAGSLGLLILSLAVWSWGARSEARRSRFLASSLVVLVALQAALGMWTVTMLLKPVIVTLHLLGGMATLALLTWLALRGSGAASGRSLSGVTAVHVVGIAGLLVLVAQIALGGWVSTNYAALACVDFPQCHGQWLPDMDFRHAFQLIRELGMTAAGTHLAYEALTAIHWTHRVGALVTTVVLGLLALLLVRTRGMLAFGVLLAVLVAAQVTLGITNILAGLPLPVAVAHNALAALLLVTLVVINFRLFQKAAR